MKTAVPEGTYIELVRSLFSTLLPTVIMAASFIAVSALVISQTPDRYLEHLAAAGSLAAIARIIVLLGLRGRANDDTVTAIEARKLEKYFAASYLTFACVFGVFSARAFWISSSDMRILVVGLVFGYASGVAAGISYRPRISVAAVTIAVVPTILVAALTGKPINWAIAGLLAVFLLGGIESILTRFKIGASGITLRRHFATLARSDALTGLSNRVALAEEFDRIVAQCPPDRVVAVHCLDLDRFKPVNDRYGHPVGDRLLRNVADRLQACVRRTDFSARIGGDEFVIIQSEISSADEAELMARRIIRSLGETFEIDGYEISIGTSIGYAFTTDEMQDLDQLIALADGALLRAKDEGRGRSVAHGSARGISLRLAM